MKVDFMIIGAQKSGTTTLFDLLNAHPQLVGSREKEPNFFSENDWQKKMKAYESLFPIQSGVLYFEATTNYTFNPHIRNKNIIQDLYAYNPNLKFIYIVRNPMERIVSSYMHGRQTGVVTEEINIAIKEDPFFIDVSKYYYQVEPYITQFGKEKVMIIDFDDLVSNQCALVSEVAKFLKVDSSINLQVTHNNNSLGTVKPNYKFTALIKSVKRFTQNFPLPIHDFVKRIYLNLPFLTGETFIEKPELTQSSKDFIISQLAGDIAKLEVVTGKSLEHWMN